MIGFILHMAAITIIVTTSIGAVAITNADAPSVPAPTAKPSTSTLDGQWLSNCRGGKISTMLIQGRSSFLREAYYEDSACKILLYFIDTHGWVDYPSPQPLQSAEAALMASEKGWPVDYSYQDITLTPANENIARQFRQSQLCDWPHWHPLIAVTITGKACRFVEGAKPVLIPLRSQRRYGIYLIREPYLFFGQNNRLEDSSIPSRRPLNLQEQPFGKRIQ